VASGKSVGVATAAGGSPEKLAIVSLNTCPAAPAHGASSTASAATLGYRRSTAFSRQRITTRL
jgi:hypothetical protein